MIPGSPSGAWCETSQLSGWCVAAAGPTEQGTSPAVAARLISPKRVQRMRGPAVTPSGGRVSVEGWRQVPHTSTPVAVHSDRVSNLLLMRVSLGLGWLVTGVPGEADLETRSESHSKPPWRGERTESIVACDLRHRELPAELKHITQRRNTQQLRLLQ